MSPGGWPDRGTVARDQQGLRDCDRTGDFAGPRARRRDQPAPGAPLRLHATAAAGGKYAAERPAAGGRPGPVIDSLDRKSTRLNSSHLGISYAVLCLKKTNNKKYHTAS